MIENPQFSIYLRPLMQLRLRNLLYLFVAVVLLSSCGGFEKIRKSSDVNYKLTKANEYFEKKDYVHANTLYKELMPIMKSTRNYEGLFYKYAYTFYYLKDYVEASYYFKNFTDYFPTSKDAEECEYMSAVCLYKYAPKYSLDQTNTTKSLEALQSYVNRYPNSKRLTEANAYIAESQKKLEMKQADAAKLYYNISQYKSATVAYKSVLRNYPESTNGDLYTFMIMKSMFKYAKASIPSKQEERYAVAISTFRELKDTYPQSKYIAEAEKVYADADNNVKKLRNEQHK
ncbi:MAG: outer membrane protein assembly factor BamD [Flavipsychrobacter sp.]|nr:outer membrane protein assembly factor BamD [Flavipsychrobacter sp.]